MLRLLPNHVINHVIKNNIGTILSCFFFVFAFFSDLQTTSTDIIRYDSKKGNKMWKLLSSLVLKAFWDCYQSVLS